MSFTIIKFIQRKLVLLLSLMLLCMIFVNFGNSQDVIQDFYQVDSLENGYKYRIMYPSNFDPNSSYPLLVFLHGAGERGDNNIDQLKHIAAIFTQDSIRNKFPAIIVFPQCAKDDYWASVDSLRRRVDSRQDPTKSMNQVIQIIDKLEKRSFINTERIHIAGLSMGGFGTFDLLARFPQRFASAIAICGGADLLNVGKIMQTPLRIYHGALDKVVPVQNSRNIATALAKLKANYEYIEYPDGTHDVWTRAMSEHDQLDWLFSYTRK